MLYRALREALNVHRGSFRKCVLSAIFILSFYQLAFSLMLQFWGCAKSLAGPGPLSVSSWQGPVHLSDYRGLLRFGSVQYICIYVWHLHINGHTPTPTPAFFSGVQGSIPVSEAHACIFLYQCRFTCRFNRETSSAFSPVYPDGKL